MIVIVIFILSLIFLFIFSMYTTKHYNKHYNKHYTKPMLEIIVTQEAMNAKILSHASVSTLLKLNTYNTKFVVDSIPGGYNGLCNIKMVVDGHHVIANSFGFGKTLAEFWTDLDHRMVDIQ